MAAAIPHRKSNFIPFQPGKHRHARIGDEAWDLYYYRIASLRENGFTVPQVQRELSKFDFHPS